MLIYTHPACLTHDPGPGHPEHAGRLHAVLDGLTQALGERLQWREAPRASDAQLARVHSRALQSALERSAPAVGHTHIDADTVLSPGSLEASRRSAGAVCAAVDAVISEPQRRAFCAVRPPGHHSTADQSMGFCLYNQIAIGARHATAVHGLQRVAIVDFDVHHGNGTQAICANDPALLYVSSHQSPLYPGSGLPDQPGASNCVNGILTPGVGSQPFRTLWRDRLLPAIDAWRPQLILISAGFDAHRLDPLADLNLDAQDYHWITAQLVDLAEKHALGRIVSTLEGGYSPSALRAGSVAHVRALLGK